ncbi:MAG TPA: Rpn family recombination-promoting nuclease/putative transposase [Gemmataceae bacterium]|jgi:predicted transposase YdaD
MMPSHEPPRKLPDQVIRESLQHPASLREFLQDAVPHLAAGFDCERARLISREFPMEDWRSREADLPFEIPYRTAEGERLALVCVLIEHQSDTDPLMPLRMLYFAVGYWDRQWKTWAGLKPPRPPLWLAPVLPIVLYTGPTPWGSNRTMVDLLTEPSAFHAFAPKWEPIFWNLAERTPQDLLNSGAAWLEMLSVLRVERAEATVFQSVFAEAAKRLAALQGREEVRWHDCLRVVLTYASWRRPPAEAKALEDIALAANPTRKEEVRRMIQTIAEELIERGRAEGHAEGRAEGALDSNREALRRLLLHKFKQLPAVVLQRIESCTDIERLKAALEHVLDMKSLDEFNL